jgi:CBS domain-containing protein
VKNVMSTHVIAVRQDATFKEMAARLRQQRVSAFPVLDGDNKVIGVVSEADLLTKPAVTIRPGETVSHTARLMYTRRVKRLRVTAEDGTLIGIVSRADVLSVPRSATGSRTRTHKAS